MEIIAAVPEEHKASLLPQLKVRWVWAEGGQGSRKGRASSGPPLLLQHGRDAGPRLGCKAGEEGTAPMQLCH